MKSINCNPSCYCVNGVCDGVNEDDMPSEIFQIINKRHVAIMICEKENIWTSITISFLRIKRNYSIKRKRIQNYTKNYCRRYKKTENFCSSIEAGHYPGHLCYSKSICNSSCSCVNGVVMMV